MFLTARSQTCGQQYSVKGGEEGNQIEGVAEGGVTWTGNSRSPGITGRASVASCEGCELSPNFKIDGSS